MVDDTPTLRLMLIKLRSSYVETGKEPLPYLKILGKDTKSFSKARAAVLEESGVDAVIARSCAGGEAVSEQEVRAFAAVLKEGIVQACLALREIDDLDHEVMWEDEVREAGADKLLGVGPCRPFRRPPPKL